MLLRAAQHVCGYLTREQSPKGLGGPQTLLYTNELLIHDETNLIEGLVKDGGAQLERAKWQSYKLPDQRPVISRIVPIPEPDEFGRRGRYFAHSLIFNAPDRRLVDDALFDLLCPDNFFSSLDAVLEYPGFETGHIPVKSVNSEMEWLGEARNLIRDWSGEQMNRLFMLVSDPQKMIENGYYVALSGNDLQILSALKVAFLLTQSPARRFYSFDTNAAGCEGQSSVTFWARGFPDVAKVSTDFVIDGALRQVRIPEASPLQAGGFFPEQLSLPLQEAIIARLSEAPQNLRLWLMSREPLYQTLLHDVDLLTDADLELLNPLGEVHRGLGLLLALKSANEFQRLRILASMDLTEYRKCVSELKTRPDFKAWQVFSPTYMSSWFDCCRGSYSMDDIVRGVSDVAKHGSEEDRQQVSYINECIEIEQREELKRWLKSSPHRLPHLKSALDEPANSRADGQSREKPGSAWQRLKRALTGSGEGD